MLVAHCALGDGVRLTVHGDTIFSIDKAMALAVPDSGQALLDYWNHHLRSGWERQLGRHPSSLASDRSVDAERMEAVWDMPNRVRHLIILQRQKDRPLELGVQCG